MTKLVLTEEVIEDAAFDMKGITKNHLALTMAEAEEETMIVGDPDHATTAVEANATEATWFNRDHRLAFYGLLTLAGDVAGSIENDTRAADRVDAAGADMILPATKALREIFDFSEPEIQDIENHISKMMGMLRKQENDDAEEFERQMLEEAAAKKEGKGVATQRPASRTK